MTLHGMVNTYVFIRLWWLKWLSMGPLIGRECHAAFEWLKFAQTWTQMTTSWLRRPLGDLQFSWDNVNSFDKLSKCCLCNFRCNIVNFQHCDGWNDYCGCPELLICSLWWFATFSNSGCVHSSSLIWVGQILSPSCRPVWEIVPITQPGSSY